MKLKMTMTNAETGEVLCEQDNLDFAMMAYGRKKDDGLEFQATTRGENLSIVMLAQCLDGVDRAVKKNCTDDAAVGMAYTLVKMGVMGDSLVDVEGETEEMSSSIKAHCGAEEVQG